MEDIGTIVDKLLAKHPADGVYSPKGSKLKVQDQTKPGILKLDASTQTNQRSIPDLSQPQPQTVEIGEDIGHGIEGEEDDWEDEIAQLVLAVQDLNKRVLSLQSRCFGTRASGNNPGGKGKTTVSPITPDSCPLCPAKHPLYKCPTFLKKSIRNRHASVKQLKVCFHCLAGLHLARDCTFRKDVLCQLDGCERYHHPLLHMSSA